MINTQFEEILSMITDALKIHLNIEQMMSINTSSILMTLKRISANITSSQRIDLNDRTQILFPDNLHLNATKNSTISLRVRFFLCKYFLLLIHKLLIVCSNSTFNCWKSC